MNKIQQRIAALRAEMEKHQLDAFYISGTDPHASEYLPEMWQTRKFISGFTGSYGVIVVTRDQVLLWTDTRYFLQAEEQLAGTGIQMQKLRVPNAVLPEDWLLQNLNKGNKLGIDAQTVSVASFRLFEQVLAEKDITVVKVPDLLEAIWQNRPSLPSNLVFELPVEITGVTRREKHQQIIAQLDDKGADIHVITMLDELAWLLNLRGSDINYNPVFTGFGWVEEKKIILFIDAVKMPDEIADHIQNDNIEIKSYTEFYPYLTSIKQKIIYLDAGTANYSIFAVLKNNNEIIEGTSVISHLKARKNQVEISGFRTAMIKDGIAMVEFLFWLKNNLGKLDITEYSAGIKLKEFRAKQPDFMGESFYPIFGYKHHGAIVHFSAGVDNALQLKPEGILLFDSGGQYNEGTTDITRTISLGEISVQQKNDFTLVLKGMIALTNAVFPEGTKGAHLDILARKALWENGLNYGHGTGHGVGHFLNVHEGPMAIRQDFNENAIVPGMVLSNEPGLYREGKYGIRIENMIVCIEKQKTEFGNFFGFDTLTLCPIDLNLINAEMLSPDEVEWLNNYHKRVNKTLKPSLKAELRGFLDDLTRTI
ncbi:MAG: aminopeptidase P family protein [Prolixibacteraceae bacterium]|nr:aminopeptidase P family protein [Prolixibacteraceae bacterium]